MTENLRDEIARRQAAYTNAPVVSIERGQELAALADAVAALEGIAGQKEVVGNTGALQSTLAAKDARAALAQIAGRLGHMDAGREGEG